VVVLTEQQEIIRNVAQRFAETRLRPGSREWEKAGAVPSNMLKEMGELGFMGMTVACEYGGAGLDYVSYALALIEIASGDGAVACIMSVNNAPVCAIFARCGTETQKNKYLTRLARGENIGAFALSEPHAGSDAANLRTRASRTGSGYCINGTKQFITSGKISDLNIVFAVTDPDLGKHGISAFIVERNTLGLSIARAEHKMGQKASDTCQLIYTNVEVSPDHLIGREGEGYRIALSNLEVGRIGIAAQSVGIAQAALSEAIRYARERKSFGRVLMEHQAVAFRLAEMATELEAARELTLNAAAMKQAGLPCLTQASMAKLFASEAAERICSHAVQIFGGYGYVEDFIVEKLYRDVRVTQIYEGTSEVQKMLISRSLKS
jgi:alkylation response protein AidB-like acyl-CoA dehydrogenase